MSQKIKHEGIHGNSDIPGRVQLFSERFLSPGVPNVPQEGEAGAITHSTRSKTETLMDGTTAPELSDEMAEQLQLLDTSVLPLGNKFELRFDIEDFLTSILTTGKAGAKRFGVITLHIKQIKGGNRTATIALPLKGALKWQEVLQHTKNRYSPGSIDEALESAIAEATDATRATHMADVAPKARDPRNTPFVRLQRIIPELPVLNI